MNEEKRCYGFEAAREDERCRWLVESLELLNSEGLLMFGEESFDNSEEAIKNKKYREFIKLIGRFNLRETKERYYPHMSAEDFAQMCTDDYIQQCVRLYEYLRSENSAEFKATLLATRDKMVHDLMEEVFNVPEALRYPNMSKEDWEYCIRRASGCDN